jgi:hypothetical protein
MDSLKFLGGRDLPKQSRNRAVSPTKAAVVFAVVLSMFLFSCAPEEPAAIEIDFGLANIDRIELNSPQEYEGYFEFRHEGTRYVGAFGTHKKFCEPALQKNLIVICDGLKFFYSDAFGDDGDWDFLIKTIEDDRNLLRLGKKSTERRVFTIPAPIDPAKGGRPVLARIGYGNTILLIAAEAKADPDCLANYYWTVLPTGKAAWFCQDEKLIFVRSYRELESLGFPLTAEAAQRLAILALPEIAPAPK